jgi:hypothetical protein
VIPPSSIEYVLEDDVQMNSDILPDWLVADLQAIQPSVAGSTPVAQALAAVLHAAGVVPTIFRNVSARVMIRACDVPVTPLGALDPDVLDREVDLASDYVAAFPADGFDARKESSSVRQQVRLVAILAGDRPCLVYARPAALARIAANLDALALLSRVAAAELRAGHAESRHAQALVAAADAWSGLREASETTLHLRQDLDRLKSKHRRQEQNASALGDTVLLAERLLRQHGEAFVRVVPLLGLFRKRKAGERRPPSDPAARGLDSSIDIASLLKRAHADWAAALEPGPET